MRHCQQLHSYAANQQQQMGTPNIGRCGKSTDSSACQHYSKQEHAVDQGNHHSRCTMRAGA
jgi:hypothetical protein